MFTLSATLSAQHTESDFLLCLKSWLCYHRHGSSETLKSYEPIMIL